MDVPFSLYLHGANGKIGMVVQQLISSLFSLSSFFFLQFLQGKAFHNVEGQDVF